MFDGAKVKQEFQEAFGFPIEDLNLKQLWWLVKFAKFIRFRARNNSAFNNYMNRNFDADFRQVPKEFNGKIYDGLSITLRRTGETLEQGEPD